MMLGKNHTTPNALDVVTCKNNRSSKLSLKEHLAFILRLQLYCRRLVNTVNPKFWYVKYNLILDSNISF